MLGCNRVTGRHTADDIMLWHEDIVCKFNVNEKVKHIITDSGSNNKEGISDTPRL